jgi:uncharacterized protein
MRRVVLLVSGLLSAALCSATESDDLLRSLRPRGMVSDYAGVLKPEERESIESAIRGYQQRTGHEIGVAVVDSLRGGDIDDFANKLFAQWGVGKKGQDNGALLLVAIKDRSARIEVGYGLEPKLTDAVAGRILREQMFPSFKQGRYGEGLSLAVARIISVVQGEAQDPTVPVTAVRGGGEVPDKLGRTEGFFWTMVFLSSVIAFLFGGGIGAKKVGLIVQSGVLFAMVLIFSSSFGVQSGAFWHGKRSYFILASMSSLIVSIFIGRQFPRFFGSIEKALERSGRSASGRRWSSGGGGCSSGGFGGGSSGGGGASGKW